MDIMGVMAWSILEVDGSGKDGVMGVMVSDKFVLLNGVRGRMQKLRDGL